MKKNSSRKSFLFENTGGFTMIELLLVMVITVFIISALFSAYLAQQQTQTAQDQVVEIQQHLRGAVNFIQREIRMAGFDPQVGASSGITTATANRFVFTQDRNDNGPGEYPGDGDTNDDDETITYGFLAADDTDNDGIADTGVAPLQRTASRTTPPDITGTIADNIEAFEFLYLVGDDLTPTLTPTAAERDSIRAVIISILARTDVTDPNFNGNIQYRPASNDSIFHNGDYDLGSGVIWGANDGFRRRMIISTIQLRNMGL